jgi:hypothetical protein
MAFVDRRLVDEQRQRGNVEGQPLGLPAPVEERLAETFQLIDGVVQ